MKNFRLFKTLILSSLLAVPTAQAQQAIGNVELKDIMIEIKQMRADYESRISDLEQQIQSLKEAKKHDLEPSDKADKGFDVDYVGADREKFHKGGLHMHDVGGVADVSIGGYADIELENFQDKESEFDQHRWIINVAAEIGERLRFFSEYEIEHGGPDAAGGGEAKVEQAWIDYLINEKINFRAGALLVPFGRYNIYHDSPLQDLTDRPLVNRDIIPTTWTEAGAGFHGVFYPSIGKFEDVELAYELYMVNGLDDGFSDTGLRGARGSLGGDNNNAKSIVGRVTMSPSIGHEVGLSGYWGAFNGEEDALAGIGVDFLTTWGPLEILGEWAYFGAQESPRINTEGTGDIANHFQGMYIQANYHFWFDMLNDTFLGRTFDNPTFTAVGRFGWVEIDDDGDTSLGNDNEEWRFTLGLNYRPVEAWVLKLEYQNNFSRHETLERGNSEGFIASIAMGF